MALLFMALGVLIGSELLDLTGIYLGDGWSTLFMGLDLTYGPLVWLLILSFSNKNRGIRSTDIWHFAPFLLVLIWLNSSMATNIFTALPSGNMSNELATFVLLKLLLIAFYLAMLHKKLIQSKHVRVPERVFMAYIIWSFTLVFLVSYGVFFMMYFGFSVWIDSDYLACILVTFLVYLLTFLILRNPDIFFQKRPFGPKYSNSNLKEEDSYLLQIQLNKLLNEQQVFLNPDLTLSGLADNLNVSTNILSQVVNEGMERKFNDLINEYRVEYMKGKLLDPSENHKKILALAFESGFQSKASFNRIFKKITGMTPIQFRELNRSHPTE
ncbi:helix-turn-helix domain-containing protein [Flagellimonas meishanensis]|uniref:helix-turn-helix domain-containing protein n=1 Tax=Flagellimonas meishanensis TaxID=2873264 RepID=UPI001CA6650C|nr:helix-turn-helix domain-containing protein [[Muricauda] meishanensis]